MTCPNFPQGKLKKIIDKTVATGNEHGFVRCGDGSTSDVVGGEKDRMNIGEAVEACDIDDGPIDIVHTHPNGAKRLSDADRKVAALDDAGSVCVAVPGGDVKCEMVDACEFEVGK